MAASRVLALVAARVLVPVAVRLAALLACTLAALLPVCAAAAVASAAPADPLQAPACQQALAALQAQEVSLQATHAASLPRAGAAPATAPAQTVAPALLALRRRAALACLGEPDAAPQRPQRQAQPAIAVPPVTLQRALPPPPLSPGTEPRQPGAPLPVPAPPSRPLAVTACDAAGCWANDGSRLNRIGPNLLGPRGICTLQAGSLNCP